MNEKNRKIMIIVTAVLLVALVVVGLIMLLNQPSGEKDNEKGSSNKDNRCVEQLCISKVSTDEENGTGVIVILKNEGSTVIKDTCVKLVSKTNSINICATELEPEGQMVQIFEKSEMGGDKIEDFSLEKGEKETTQE